jgi:hypothetical protein
MAQSESPTSYRLTFATLCITSVMGAALFLFSRSPTRVEIRFTQGFGHDVNQILSGLSGTVPTSIAEWIEGAAILWLIVTLLHALRQIQVGTRTLEGAIGVGILRGSALVALVLVGFYSLWGLNYARAPAVERLGWTTVDLDDPGSVDDLDALALDLVTRVNTRYRTRHRSDDLGTMSTSVDRALDPILDEGWRRVVADLGLHPSVAVPRGPAKPLLSSPLWSRLGIAGFYFPFTGEANYNRDQPQWQLAHTIAHEQAHQRGFASEDEANFFGFLACVYSDDDFVRYGGWLFAQRKILSALLKVRPERASELIEMRVPGVQRDVDGMRAFWKRYQGAGTTVGSAVNDAYLRANRVEGGIQSYSLSTRLIVAWFRENPSIDTATDIL